ncbi:MAG TPA: hypothetical protein VEY31_11625 [Roseococcus sp.]|jgi:hypothetical protein|nr:hypothetical protein [Roseococcus sp.]
MSQKLTTRGFALAAAALRLATVARTAKGTAIASKPVRSSGARRKLSAK